MNKNQRDLALLPNYFKKIAFAILFASILFFVLTISKILEIDKELSKTIFETSLLLSLLMLTMSKSKIEDEQTLRIRLRAYSSSFLYGALIIIITPFIRLLFNGNFITNMGTFQLLVSMFLFYFIIFYYLKRNR